MRIRIVSWEKFNPRKDVKASSWLRFENNFFSNPRFFKCSVETKLIWIYFLCEASQKQSGDITICPDLIFALTKIPNSKILSSIEQLIENDQIVVLNKIHTRVEDNTYAIGDVTEITRARVEDNTYAIGKLSHSIPTDGRTNGRTDDISQTGNQSDTLTPKLLAELWNQLRSPNQPAVKISSIKSGSSRYRHALARIAEEPDPTYWETVVKKISASPFCNGSNERDWKANFDFLVKPDKHHKVCEGTYDQHIGAATKYARPEDIV